MSTRPAATASGPDFNMRRRQLVATIAVGFVGSLNWSDDAAHDYPAGRLWDNGPVKGYKCFLFIHDVLSKAGIDMGFPHATLGGSYPYNAGDWAAPGLTMRQWRLLGDREPPMAGDVLAQQADYSDATGHVVIVGSTDNWIGTGTWPGKPVGVIVSKSLSTPLVHSGSYPRVVRRYTGS